MNETNYDVIVQVDVLGSDMVDITWYQLDVYMFLYGSRA